MVGAPDFTGTLDRMEKQRTLTFPRSAGLLLVALAWALFLTVTGSPEAVLFTLPVFLLAAPLAFGHYTGEEFLRSLTGRRIVVRRSLHVRVIWTAKVPGPGRLDALLLPGRSPPGLTA